MINIGSSSFRQDPYPHYDEIRKCGHAVYSPGDNVWYVGRYEDVARILQDSDTFMNKLVSIESTLSGADGALHLRSRKILQKAFNKTRMTEMGAEIDRLANHLVDNMLMYKQCDFVTDIASHMPSSVVMWMMGFENIDVADICRWSQAIVSKRTREIIAKNPDNSFIRGLFDKFKNRKYSTTADDINECRFYLTKHFEKARKTGSKGWVTDYIVNQTEEENLSMRELLDIGFLMIIAGAETTTDLLGNAVLFLANNPDLQTYLREKPELLEPFIEEVLRYDAPVQLRPRYTAKDTIIGNVPVSANSKIVVLIGSANRDPEVFSEAERFKVDRAPNRHLSFGLGRHFCLGAQLARRESFALLDGMIRKLPPVKLARPDEIVEYPENVTLRGPRRLGIKFE